MEQNDQWVEDRLAKLDPESEWQPHVTTALLRFEQRRARSRFLGPRTVSVAIVAVVCLLSFPAPRVLAQRVIAPCVEACESLVLGQADFHAHLQRLFWSVHNFLGLTAPDFAATDSTGANFQLSDYAGKVVLLNFWATWCKPCRQEIPWFVEFQRTFGNQKFAVVGISLDEDGWKPVRPFMEAQKVSYRVAIGNDALAQKYGGLQSLPETLLIRGDGIILVKHVGITSKDQYEREIVRALWSQLSGAERDRFRPEGLE
jgi:cytochrome c biogenesis protein CcmG/thiol:disulfide interchange protein DsbE